MATNLLSQELVEALGDSPAQVLAGQFLFEVATGDNATVHAHVSQFLQEVAAAASATRSRAAQLVLEVHAIRTPNPLSQLLVEPHVDAVSSFRVTQFSAEGHVEGVSKAHYGQGALEAMGWKVGRIAHLSGYLHEIQGGTPHKLHWSQSVLEALVSIEPQPKRLSQFLLEVMLTKVEDCFRSGITVYRCKAPSTFTYTCSETASTTVVQPTAPGITIIAPRRGLS